VFTDADLAPSTVTDRPEINFAEESFEAVSVSAVGQAERETKIINGKAMTSNSDSIRKSSSSSFSPKRATWNK